MKKPILKTVSSTMQEKEKVRKIRDESLNTAISQIEQSYGKGSIMKLGDNKERADVDVISTGSIGLDIALGIGGLLIAISLGIGIYHIISHRIHAGVQ